MGVKEVTKALNARGERTRLAALKSDRDRARAALARIKVQLAPQVMLEPDQIERFGAFMRERITIGETAFRKAICARSSTPSRSTTR